VDSQRVAIRLVKKLALILDPLHEAVSNEVNDFFLAGGAEGWFRMAGRGERDNLIVRQRGKVEM
jgi:hypothetical protein